MATFTGGPGNDTLTSLADADTLDGAAGNDSLVGNGGNDLLLGGADEDVLLGGAGVDTLDGGTGADLMYGGAGGDTYIVDDLNDRVIESGVEVGDVVKTSVSFEIPMYVETMLLTGIGDIRGNGNTQNNTITGNDGKNFLWGDAGKDTLDGGLGDDIVKGGAGADSLTGGGGNDLFRYGIFSESTVAAGTFDVITDFTIGQDKIDVSQMDANTGVAGYQTFTFVTTSTFTAAGQIRFDAKTSMLYANVGGDLNPDFAVKLNGVVTPLTSADFVLIDVIPPTITSGATAKTLAERSGSGQVVYTAAIDDGPVTFSLAAGGDASAFSINATTGAVTLLSNPNYEAKSSYSFTLVATDQAGNGATQAVTLSITNVDEVRPTITSPSSATAPENSSFVYDAEADDSADISAGVTWSISGTDASLLKIDAGTGVVTLKSGTLNFEGAKTTYNFTVTANDTVTTPVSMPVTVSVTDVNEAPTDLALSKNTIAENSDTKTGVLIGSITITDPDAGPHANTLSVDDTANFEIRNATELWFIGASPNFESKTTTFGINLTSTDGALVYSEPFTINVTDVNEAPTVATEIGDQSTFTGAAFSFAFDAKTFTDVDAGDSLTYSAELAGGGQLPGWLSFDAGTRTFSGTAAEQDVGTIVVRVTATDEGTLNTFDDFEIDIISADTEATGTVTVSGYAVEGAVLTAGIAGLADANGGIADFDFQWQSSDDGDNWVDVGGETGQSFDMPDDQTYVGDYIRVLVTTTDYSGFTSDFESEGLLIANVNDPAVIGGDTSATRYETNAAADLNASGTLTIDDDDGASQESFTEQTDVDGSYGTFSIDSSGAWTYTADGAHDEFADGQTYTDAFTVTSADGTTATVTINLVGSQEPAEFTGLTSADLTETDAPQTFGPTPFSVTDSDGADTFVPQVTPGSYGTFTLDNSTGTWDYEMDGAHDEFVGGQTYVDTFIVSAADGTTQAITITITGSNDAAVIGGTSTGALTEGDDTVSAALSIFDVDGADEFAPQTDTAGSYGTFDLATNGTWTYDTNGALDALAGTTYTDTFTAYAADGTTQSVVITITGVNDDAVIGGDTSKSVNEGDDTLQASGTLTVDDPDSAETFAEQTTAGTYGTFDLNSDGSWTYDTKAAFDALAVGQSNVDTFVVASADGTTSQVTITINGTNDDAQFSNTDGSLTEGDSMSGGTMGVVDVDGADTFVPQDDAAGAYGTLDLASNGAWTYTTANDFDTLGTGDTLTETFVVASADGTTTNLVITINGVNDDAVIGGTSTGAVTEGDDTLSAALTITDVDGPDEFAPQTDTAGSYGTFDLATNGTWTYDTNGALDALAGTTYTDTFTAYAADGTTQSVVITITGVNDDAVIGGDTSKSVNEGDDTLQASGTLTVDDPDSAETFAEQTTAGTYGTFDLNSDGSWTYDTNAAFDTLAVGQSNVDTFVVASADGTTSQVTITINGTNDDAQFSNTDGSLTEGDSMSGGTMGVVDVDGSSTFVPQDDAAGAYGTLDLASNGAWTYTTANDFDTLGTGDTLTETFVVASADGTTTNLVITITGVNDAAVIGGTSTGAVTEGDDTLSASLSITDVDGADEFTPQTDTAGTYGTFDLATDGTWTYDTNGALDQLVGSTTYTDTFTAYAADGTTQTVQIVITGVNDAASIGGTSTGALTEGDDTVSAALNVSDVDGADEFAPQTDTAGNYGTFDLATNGNWTYDTNGALDALAGSTTYTDTFTAYAADGTTQTVQITISGVNDAAVIGGDKTKTITEGDDTVAGALTADDPDSPETFVGQVGVAGSHGTFSLLSTGAWTYDTNGALDSLAGSTTYTDTFTVATADGTTSSVTITINGVNDAPTITSGAQSGSVTEDGTQTANGTVTATDPDAGATKGFTGNGSGTYGTFSVNATSGAWTYTINNTAAQPLTGSQTATETYTVVVTDDKGATATQSVTITINGADEPVNNAPTITVAPVLSATGVVFTANDVDAGDTLVFGSPYGTFGSVNKGTATTLNVSTAEQASVLGGQLLVVDSQGASVAVGVYIGLGSSAAETMTVTGANPGGLWGFGGNDSLNGNGAADWLIGGAGDDQLTGNGGTDTYVVASGTDTITDYVAGETLTNTATANLSFAGAFTATSTLSNNGTVNITSTSGASITLTNATGPNGYNVSTSATATTVTGSSFNDSITGAAGNDVFTGAAGSDTLVGGTGADNLTGGSNTDTFSVNFGHTVIASNTGFDVITDFGLNGGDVFDSVGSFSIAAATGGGVNGTNSSANLAAGNPASSHSIAANGIITFDNNDTYSAAESVGNSGASFNAALQYLQANDFGTTGTAVIFMTASNSFVFIQGSDDGSSNNLDIVVQLTGVAATGGLTTTAAASAVLIA